MERIFVFTPDSPDCFSNEKNATSPLTHLINVTQRAKLILRRRENDEMSPSVFRPCRLVMSLVQRHLLAVADRLDSFPLDAQVHKVLRGFGRPLIAERQVVFRGAALVRRALPPRVCIPCTSGKPGRPLSRSPGPPVSDRTCQNRNGQPVSAPGSPRLLPSKPPSSYNRQEMQPIEIKP